MSSLPAAVHNPGPLGTVTRHETQFVLMFAAAICLITSIPYFAAWKTSTQEEVFSGVLMHSVDVNNYLGYSRQGKSGRWLFHNPMTGEQHADVFFNLEWLIIGKAAQLLHLSLTAATDLLRIICIGLMCCGVYWLSAFFFSTIFLRRIAMAGITCGGGFGWIVAVHLLRFRLDSSYFIDLSNANLFPFYWMLKLPHFLFSETFVVFGMCAFLRAENRRSTRDYVNAGALYLLAGACRPYDMLYLMLLTALYLGWRLLSERSFENMIVRSLPVWMCVPFLAYYYWIFKIHSIFRWWSMPGRPAPEPWRLLLGFGITSALALLAVGKMDRVKLTPNLGFMLLGVLTATALTYSYHFLHFAFQFATNILIPGVILVLVVLEREVLRLRERRWGELLIIGLLFANSLTSIALTGHAILLAKGGEFLVDARLLQAYSWLDQHVSAREVVLADFDVSNRLPQYAPNPVFCGYPNAVRFSEKEKALDLFLSPNVNDAYREELLKQNSIHIFLLTSAEQQQLNKFMRSSAVKKLYSNESVAVFYAAFF